LEKVIFLPEQPMHIAAPHFVFFIKDYLEKKYGATALKEGGLKVITTLDYDLQKKAEEITLAKSKENEELYGGTNAAVVIIDPKTGQILSMIGSRDYFDKTIDGNFNVATALRQPGSSFKPIVYALAFKKGYTEKTTLFDVETEFNSSCDPTGKPLHGNSGAKCYMPQNYDSGARFRGPMTLRDGLAQSINIVAVKLLYLVGVQDSIKMAHNLGVTSLNEEDRYGLSLVIGGGETSLLDMTSVYGVFANEGVRNPYQAILSVEKESGDVLEKYENKEYKIIEPNVTRILSSILSDNKARTPTFGANSVLVIQDRDVAVKTGTTNDNKDALTIGYTPSVVVGVWVGNNDNTPMKKGGAAMAGPTWNAIMREALQNKPVETFNKPDPTNTNTPPILRGFWQGGETFVTDKISGGLATEYTPESLKNETSITNVHTILYWIDKKDPLGSSPEKMNDPQYNNWEYGVQKWWQNNQFLYKKTMEQNKPNFYDNIHTENTKPSFKIIGFDSMSYPKNKAINFSVIPKNINSIKKIDVFINSTYLVSLKSSPFQTSFIPKEISDISTNNTLKIIGYDSFGNSGEESVSFVVNEN
jgi:membrane peptidoglycan carboxypeptidase